MGKNVKIQAKMGKNGQKWPTNWAKINKTQSKMGNYGQKMKKKWETENRNKIGQIKVPRKFLRKYGFLKIGAQQNGVIFSNTEFWKMILIELS